VNSAMQMLFIGVLSFAGMLLTPPPFTEVAARFSTSSIIGVIYLAVIGSGAFSAYNYLLAHEPSIRIVSYAFVNPVIAVLIGILIGKEKVVPYLYLGLPLILFGLFMMFYGGIFLKKMRARGGD
jgi:drug/metabolite transporter (DMT)-like permease